MQNTEQRAWPLEADLRIPVSLACYPQEVVFRTCYSFTERAYLWLEPSDGGTLIVALTAKPGQPHGTTLAGEFANALIDFALRQQVASQTGTIRDTLVRAAMAGLQA